MWIDKVVWSKLWRTACAQTDGQTDGRTDKSLKTEGPMLLSIDIFYFKTVIIGGPIYYTTKSLRTYFTYFGL